MGGVWKDVGLAVLRREAVGCFVRLKVECAYCLAQILDIFEDAKAPYQLGEATTSIFLIVAFDSDKTLARLSYISDGPEISPLEFGSWRAKLTHRSLLVTRPAASGVDGNIAKLTRAIGALAIPHGAGP